MGSEMSIRDRPRFSNSLFSFKNSIADEIKVAIDDFISTAPLPQSWLFIISPENGPKDQSSELPSGTTSTCPAKHKFGDFFPYLAYKFTTSSSPSPKVSILQSKPWFSKIDLMRFIASCPWGVILFIFIKSDASLTGSKLFKLVS